MKSRLTTEPRGDRARASEQAGHGTRACALGHRRGPRGPRRQSGGGEVPCTWRPAPRHRPTKPSPTHHSQRVLVLQDCVKLRARPQETLCSEGKKKTALNKHFLLHLGKARPRGKTKHPRQQTGGRLEPGVGWTGKEPSPWGSSGHWEPLYLLNCLLHRILGKQHHRPGVKPGPRGQRNSIPKPFVSHVCHFT